MKAYEIQTIANKAIAEFMADGFMIECMGEIHRNDSVILVKRNGSKQDIRMVKMEKGNEWNINEQYDLDTIMVNVYNFNGVEANFTGVLWEDRADSVDELVKLYTAKGWGRDGWYTGKEEALERYNKRSARREARRISKPIVQLNAENVSDQMLEKIRSIRGLKRANRKNMTIEKQNGQYNIYFDFLTSHSNIRKVVVDAKHGLMTV